MATLLNHARGSGRGGLAGKKKPVWGGYRSGGGVGNTYPGKRKIHNVRNRGPERKRGEGGRKRGGLRNAGQTYGGKEKPLSITHHRKKDEKEGVPGIKKGGGSPPKKTCSTGQETKKTLPET